MIHQLILSFLYMDMMEEVKMYELTCPSYGEWNIRAIGACNNTIGYTCLYDAINEQYMERCDGPHWDRIGAKRIISGSFTRGNCRAERFQPFTFWTNRSSDCALEKPLCAEDGQIIYNNGSAMEDRSCRCDHSRNYAFVKTPNNESNCFPATEDCTCYLKTCPGLFQLSLDYECILTLKSTEMLSTNPIYKVTTVSWTENVGIRENIASLYDYAYNFRKDAATATLISFIVMVALVTTIFVLKLTKCGLAIVPSIFSPFLMNIFLNDIQKLDSASGNSTEPTLVIISNSITNQLGLVECNEINYVRIMHLLFRVATPIVRIKFDCEFHPDLLQRILLENKMKLQELRKRNRINQNQWNLLFPSKNGKTVSSEQFDLRLMIILIGEMSDLTIGDLRPVPMDTRPDADLSRIKFIRNIITQSATGQLSDNDFIQNWTDLTQAILRLGTAEIRNINQANENNAQLVDRILKLSPLNYEKENMFRFVTLVDKFYPEIINQIIKQYCLNRKISVEDLLKEEKHDLFHLRYKSKNCCRCKNDLRRILSENLWKQLYDQADVVVHPNCSDEKTCAEYFVPKQEISSRNMDEKTAVSLILHIRGLFEHFCDRLFASGFHIFLKEHQHTIYHAITNEQCCQCAKDYKTTLNSKIMINWSEWSILFKTQCSDSPFSRTKTRRCSNTNCCCKYRPLKDLKHTSVDRNLLCRILKISGPFDYFDCIQEKLLLHGNLDDDRLVKINMETKKTLDALLNVLSDENIRLKIRQEMSSLIPLQMNDERKEDVRNWILKQLEDKQSGENAGPRTSILVQDKERWVLKDLKGFKESETSILQKRTFESLTKEERNFLRIVHSLKRIVSPALRERFNLECPPDVMGEILVSLYQGVDYNQISKENKPRLNVYLTKTQKEILYPSNGTAPSSDDFDMKLMIYILQHREQQNTNDDIVVDNADLKSDLKTINSIRRKIMQSPNGLLCNTEFQEYWTTLKQVAIRLGGEKYQTLCTELENRAASTVLNK